MAFKYTSAIMGKMTRAVEAKYGIEAANSICWYVDVEDAKHYTWRGEFPNKTKIFVAYDKETKKVRIY